MWSERNDIPGNGADLPRLNIHPKPAVVRQGRVSAYEGTVTTSVLLEVFLMFCAAAHDASETESTDS